MKDELISFETAKLAKEKAFNIISDTAYCKQGILRTCNPNFNLKGYHNKGEASLAPTQSLLQKWLREVHGIFVSVTSYDKDFIIQFSGYKFQHHLMVINTNNKGESALNIQPNDFETYDKALEYGIEESLKLIKNE